MNNGNFNWIANFIWGITDDVLRDVYVRGKYRDVILPMTVIRRLDAVLEPTNQAVLAMKQRLDAVGITHQEAALRQASGQAFYNTSSFTLRDLKPRARAQQLKADFEAYLDGFSPNVQEILDKFKFRNQIPTLVEADILGHLIEKFLDNAINLSPEPVRNTDGSVRLPALDTHAMGTIFEELIRRFNEENNEEAGEHFTPRDVVRLVADLIFLPIADQIESGAYLVYDGACGTGGMLTVAEARLAELAHEHGKEVSIHLFGQEVNPETYSITKADLLLKGEGGEVENFRLGGRDGIKDPRFVIEHAGDPEFKLITRSSDSQLMFLVNKLAKMKHNTPLGSRIAEVHRPGKTEADPLRGRYALSIDGKSCVVEYEPDPELRDTEQVLLLEEGGSEAFVRREVLPHVPDAWIDADTTKIGYEISFTRYFYRAQPLRTLEEIRADLEALQKESEGLLEHILLEG